MVCSFVVGPTIRDASAPEASLKRPQADVQRAFSARWDDLEVRILVVEDDKHVALAVRRGLEDEGYAVDVALTGTDGEWFATENAYDAMVLDVMLPELAGDELCARLRASGSWVPILMLTARAGAEEEARALDAGADDFLAKPFSFVVLMARIRALLRRGAARTAVRPDRRATSGSTRRSTASGAARSRSR